MLCWLLKSFEVPYGSKGKRGNILKIFFVVVLVSNCLRQETQSKHFHKVVSFFTDLSTSPMQTRSFQGQTAFTFSLFIVDLCGKKSTSFYFVKNEKMPQARTKEHDIVIIRLEFHTHFTKYCTTDYEISSEWCQ